jgi:hypothetical protein
VSPQATKQLRNATYKKSDGATKYIYWKPS